MLNAFYTGFEKQAKTISPTTALSGAIAATPTLRTAMGKSLSDEAEARLHLAAGGVLVAPQVIKVLKRMAKVAGGRNQKRDFVNFYRGSFKRASEHSKRVSTVAIIKDGKLLMGKRRDNGKWTTPGGHLNEGENPFSGALREVKEETGLELDAKKLKRLNTIKNDKLSVYGWLYDADGEDISTSMKDDPDGEVHRWLFVDSKTKEDKDLHVPRSKNNVLLPAIEV